MKLPHFYFAFCAIGLGCPPISGAAVIQTPGLIRVDGRLEAANGRQTMDWLIFEVTSPTVLYVDAWVGVANSHSSWLVLGQLLGESNLLSNVSLDTPSAATITGYGGFLSVVPGRWVAGFAPITTARDSSSIADASWDQFMRHNGSELGVFGYTIVINGDVQAVEWREGALDGTFKVTPFEVPEPSGGMLLCLTAAALSAGRRARRKTDVFYRTDPASPTQASHSL